MSNSIHIHPAAGSSAKKSGADICAEILTGCGIELFFIEEHRQTEKLKQALELRSGVKVIQPVSDISCVPMADICARYTGRPSAAVTSGAGHCLNQIMGITTAWGDKSPVISIGIISESLADRSPVFDREMTDLTESFKPVTVYTAKIRSLREITPVIQRAVGESTAGKGGAVHVEISEALLAKEDCFDITNMYSLNSSMENETGFRKIQADPVLLEKAAEMLFSAKRPIIYAGGGVVRSGASEELHEFSRVTGVPMLASLGAMDLLETDHPSYVGPSSYLSGEAFHTAVKESDVCFAIGTCFSELDGFGLPPIWSGKIKFIQVNISHEYIALNPPADIALVADAGEALRGMISICRERETLPDFSRWRARLKKKNREHHERVRKEAEKYSAYKKNKKNPKLHPYTAFSMIRDHLITGNTVGVMDGGNTALWGGMIVCATGPRRFHFPTGMATLGVGIPMAIALKAAAPDKRVLLVSGDGSFLFNVQELELIKKYDLPVTIVINNDSSWNMMRLGETLINRAISAPLPPVDYTKIADSFGISSVRVSTPEEWEGCRERVMQHDGAMVVELIADSEIQPDSIVSFIRGELMGSIIPPWKKLRRIYQSELGFGMNTLNLLRFLMKTI